MHLTIRDAQTHQPWTVPYSNGVKHAHDSGQIPHILSSHVVLYAAKSVGKLASVFEALDHSNNRALTQDQITTIRDMSADLMTAALRLANLWGFDLESELQRRVYEKNGVPIL